MAQPQSSQPDFAHLFQHPTIERMLNELSDDDFEDFVGYVFRQAGYHVEDTALHRGPGLDLKLYAPSGASPLFHAGVQVKHYLPAHKISAGEIRDLRGGLPEDSRVTGYFVTTSTFGTPALGEAQRERRIWPIDGDHFLRYMTYVRGSRPMANYEMGHDSISEPSSPYAPISPEALFTADGITRRPSSMTKVLALANHKGGVGKTTTALNLAFGLAADDRDKQVLLVDLDSQANLTRAVGHPHAQDGAPMHVGEYFAGRRGLAELVRPTQFKRVWLIPSDTSLALADRGLAAGPEAELRFARDLHAADVAPPPVLDARPFDWIIIDTGPSMGFFTRSALAAAHFVLMPIVPGAFAELGIDVLRQTVATMHALTGQPITILGSLVTQWKDDRLNNDLLARARVNLDAVGWGLITPEIPLDKTNIEKAHLETGAGRKKNLFDRRCAAARAYSTIVDKLLGAVYAWER